MLRSSLFFCKIIHLSLYHLLKISSFPHCLPGPLYRKLCLYVWVPSGALFCFFGLLVNISTKSQFRIIALQLSLDSDFEVFQLFIFIFFIVLTILGPVSF